MKRYLSIIFCALFAVMQLSGCGDKAVNRDAAERSAETGPSAQIQEEQDRGASEDTLASQDEPESAAGASTEEIIGENAQQAAVSEEECRAEIDLLRRTEAVHPAETELLAQMAGLVTFSRVMDEQGVIFSEMDNNSRAALRRQILDGVMWGESDFYQAIATEPGEGRYDADRIVAAEDAETLFREIYGEKDFTPAEYETVEDGYILLSFADGDPWHIVEHMQYYEDDRYYLVSGPAFYEDNGGTMEFLGYADILFEKNPDSRYGVTLLYGRYRREKINVTSVEASSELPPSGGKSYTGMNLVDDDYTTIWSEGVPGTGIGEMITLHLDETQPVYGILIYNGYTASYEQYTNNGMLTDVQVDFGNGIRAEGHDMKGYGGENYSVQDLAGMNCSKVELEEPVMTDTIIITITGADKGSRFDDTCVSEIQVY